MRAGYSWTDGDSVHRVKFRLEPGVGIVSHEYIGVIAKRGHKGQTIRAVGCPCGSPPLPRVSWLGLRWVGIPDPVRWWLDRFHITEWRGRPVKYNGCGCMYKPKLALTMLRQWIKA